jgi:hypothetical protein
MKKLMEQMGQNENTLVHGIGDGALWIPEQGERVAAHKYSHLIDLYHLCDYFSKAVKSWTENVKEEVDRLKNLCKEGLIGTVIKELKSRQEIDKGHEGLKACIQYIENRPGRLTIKIQIHEFFLLVPL